MEMNDCIAFSSLPEGNDNVGTGKDDNEEDEEEEEDVDFNPFLIAGTPSEAEASSSLSSDDEFSADVSRKHLVDNSSDFLSAACLSPALSNEAVNCYGNPGNEHGEVVTRNTHQQPGASNQKTASPRKGDNYESTFTGNVLGGKTNEISLSNGNQGVPHDESAASEDTLYGQVSSHPQNNTQKHVLEVEDEDAICRRTRARHSLADYTLDELEAFLQESDEDDSLQNVDDEDEYRKFLTAVLRGGDGEQVGQGDETCDEDEDNDADFEIEIEEALESDVDEGIGSDKHPKSSSGHDGHRPETRQKVSQKNQKKPVRLTNLPLRPILPSVSNAQPVSFYSLGYRLPYPKDFENCSSLSSSSNITIDTGFTASQLGQLYCLIHEHAQLLIQIFSLCVLDPSRQHIASTVRKLIVEMAEKREEALVQRKMPYPSSFFDNLHVYQSEQSIQEQNSDCPSWRPTLSNPIMSILDVASLRLVQDYIADVSTAVSKYRGSQVEGLPEKSHLMKAPLFPLRGCYSTDETSSEVTVGTIACQNTTFQPSTSQPKPKKSLAAVLVENTKKQSVALVPQSIAELAQRFIPLFNSAIFPHKPPLPAIANRILFTDSEDRLLGMGLMEYNNDWLAIQQRFLPCKSRHQIFVRQKNRSSSKAPENPIKAVRRMKTSPLTANEMALISKGLKVFKNDWIAVWKFFVPYRDPSLLPRQWRIASGTQKSYKTSEPVKEKRRLYEAERRRLRASVSAHLPVSEKEAYETGQYTADDNMNEEDDAYVHEAFLAEPELGSCNSRALTNQSAVLSCQNHEDSAVKVVKLAPGLPPVNLPPTVRVISQSAFRSYIGVSSNFKGTSKNLVPGIPQGTQFVNSLKSSRKAEVVSNNHKDKGHMLDPSKGVNFSQVPEENHPGSDNLMHPLLFQASESGCPPYYPYNCTTSTSNFLPGHVIQYNLNFFLPGQSNRMIGTPPENFEASPLGLQTIDFHPLLQRAENINAAHVATNTNNNTFGSSEHFEGNMALSFCTSDGASNEPQMNPAQFLVNAASTSRHEKENDLDLDIHLCSATNKVKKGADAVIAFNAAGSGSNSNFEGREIRDTPADTPNSRANCRASVIQSDRTSTCNESHPIGSSETALLTDASCKYPEDSGEDFLSQIVMEQEELSDSDEDIEHVEFECEEMDDSEGEQLDNDYPSEYQNQGSSCHLLKGDHLLAGMDIDEPNIPRARKSDITGDAGSFSLRMQEHPGSCMYKSVNSKSKRKGTRKTQSVKSLQSGMPSRRKQPTRKNGKGSK